MNILVTGATGFIGFNLVKKLRHEGNTVFCTLLENEKNIFGEDIVQSIIISKEDIFSIIEFLMRSKIDGIIHLASFVQSGQHYATDVEKLISSNISFGSILIEAASLAKINWFINTGTYWQNFDNMLYSPVNLYAATKQAFINIAEYYICTNKINFVTLKLFETYGPNDNRQKIFNIWKKNANSEETLDMTKGDQVIDVSYIDDITAAYLIIARKLQSKNTELSNGGIYAVKAEKRYTLKELAVIFEKVTGQKLKIKWGGRSYNERNIITPYDKDEIVPGWKPIITIEDGIQKIFNNQNTIINE